MFTFVILSGWREWSKHLTITISVGCWETRAELMCGVYGRGAVFPVELERSGNVVSLPEAIVKEKKDVNAHFNVDPAEIRLYLVWRDDKWLVPDEELGSILRSGDTGFTKMRQTSRLEKYFGTNYKPGTEDVHVLMKLPAAKELCAKRQKIDTAQEELWRYWEELTEPPAVYQLPEFLRQPLPFRLAELCDSMEVGGIFKPDGPLLWCAGLSVPMKMFLIMRDCIVVTRSDWREYYGLLFRRPQVRNSWQLILRSERYPIDETGDIMWRKRPNYAVQYKELVILRGEEHDAPVDMHELLTELAAKMSGWNTMLYGDFPNTLGVETSSNAF